MITKILVIAEHEQDTLKAVTLNTFGAANKIRNQWDVLVAGEKLHALANTLSRYDGVENVLIAEHDNLKNQLAEPLTQVVLSLVKQYNYTHILVPASTFGKNILPRIAACLDVAAISDVIRIYEDNIYEHPIYAGNAITKCQSRESVQCLSIRHTAFDAAKEGSNSASLKEIDLTKISWDSSRQCKFIALKASKSERPDLSTARIVISGGRGLGSKENFKLIEKLADKLGAAVGASRAAVDAGYVPNDYQVGQTGKIVAPELYIAIGISGAIQHLAGMKDSKVVVAINKDKDAPIFEIADFGLVADLFTVLSELDAQL